MKFFSRILVLAFPALPLLAAGQEGAFLDYRLKVRSREGSAQVETGFRVVASPALVTRNRVQRPRMGGWRIEALGGKGAAPSPLLLARTLGLCYFSGPTAQMLPLATGIKLGGRWCRLWQVQTPPDVGAYVYLAEVAPNLLALAYLSAMLPDGDYRSMEIHLAGLTLGSRVAPAEEGTALLRTLQHWSEHALQNGPGGPDAGGPDAGGPDAGSPDALETEAVQ